MYFSHRIGYFLPVLLVFTLFSCIPNKQVTYLEKNNNFSHEHITSIENQNTEYILQAGDVINIRIKTLDVESSAYFNILSEEGVFNYNEPGLYINSYSINDEGIIELPEVGPIMVSGLTISDCQKLVKEEMGEFLNNATIFVKLVSFKITVLGEVRNPGYYYIYNDRATLLEGLGLSSDLTDFGDRENISIIRQTKTGSEVKVLNLNDADVLQSDFFYLKPNDVIYVPPVKGKIKRSNYNNLTLLTVLFSGISAMVLLLNYINP